MTIYIIIYQILIVYQISMYNYRPLTTIIKQIHNKFGRKCKHQINKQIRNIKQNLPGFLHFLHRFRRNHLFYQT